MLSISPFYNYPNIILARRFARKSQNILTKQVSIPPSNPSLKVTLPRVRRCGWCEGLGTCMLQNSGYNICPSDFSSVCAGLTISGFEPTHGPVEGGTLVTIRGTNLGSRPSDISSVKIAGQ